MTDPRMIRFFVDVQNKTKLETNLQASGVLPSLNTFEARAMRVVVSSLHRFNPNKEPKDELQAERNEAEILADLIYNSVTALIVGEKVMIEMPTFWFPAGAGVSQVLQRSPTTVNQTPRPHSGSPSRSSLSRNRISGWRCYFLKECRDKESTPDQNKLAGVTGPLRIWVVLDGYLTRDVQ